MDRMRWLLTVIPKRGLAYRKSKARGNRPDPGRLKKPIEVFEEDIQPGKMFSKRPGTTQATWANVDKPIRLVEESVRSKARERTILYMVRSKGQVIPHTIYYEDRDMFFMYDGRPTAKNRVLIYPRRIVSYPEDIVVPNLPILAQVVDRLSNASEFLKRKPRIRGSSVAFHIQIGDPLDPKDVNAFTFDTATGGPHINPFTVATNLISQRRMSIDSLRCFRGFMERYKKYYRYGTRFDLLPPYEPIPAPE